MFCEDKFINRSVLGILICLCIALFVDPGPSRGALEMFIKSITLSWVDRGEQPVIETGLDLPYVYFVLKPAWLPF